MHPVNSVVSSHVKLGPAGRQQDVDGYKSEVADSGPSALAPMAINIVVGLWKAGDVVGTVQLYIPLEV